MSKEWPGKQCVTRGTYLWACWLNYSYVRKTKSLSKRSKMLEDLLDNNCFCQHACFQNWVFSVVLLRKLNSSTNFSKILFSRTKMIKYLCGPYFSAKKCLISHCFFSSVGKLTFFRGGCIVHKATGAKGNYAPGGTLSYFDTGVWTMEFFLTSGNFMLPKLIHR